MDDSSLTRISLAVFAAGMILLFAVTSMALPRQIEISAIKPELIGSSIQVTGVLESVSRSNGNIFLTIRDDSGSIEVVVFEDAARKIVDNLQKGKNTIVSGRVGMYKSKIEIIADGIKVI